MRIHSRSLPYKMLACSALALMLAGCGPNEVGPYSQAKDGWDSPPTEAQLQDLRHRAALTQRDH